MKDAGPFLEKSGWGDAHRAPLAGDASARRYDRLIGRDGSAILMMDPSSETVEKFLAVTKILEDRGYSVPRIMEQDAADGFVLMEDFGDALFASLLAGGADEPELYRLAVDFLIDLGQQPVPEGLPRFTSDYVLDQNGMFLDWFAAVQAELTLSTEARDFYQQIWTELLSSLEQEPGVILLRDFHAENVFHLEGRPGLRALGLIDYQDAMVGPAAYDLVSLFQDARRDVPETLEQDMVARYMEATGAEPEAFLRSYALLGAHRALRILGIFVRLIRQQGKPKYEAFMPRMKGYLWRNLAHPDLVALRHWLDVTLGETLK
ncbi:aminoglycoside phosphotransferase family protein [Sneathiella chinensis]|uniref:Aminoglycoside phosphotransferase n=1 Tax=Sneathiella chinensis TaxID=349750 RepID=A0ABQ5U0N2_9PROT|nr:phosphotransferase [Sneathiella chinensis]GLQ04869.1 aminoglycoside phosphotransferase [Sneathiella chinensis]